MYQQQIFIQFFYVVISDKYLPYVFVYTSNKYLSHIFLRISF